MKNHWITAGVFLFLAACSRPTKAPPKTPHPVSIEDLGFSQKDDSGVATTVHRTGTGELDDSGWCRAASTEGNFSVLLPNVFNDFTMTAKAEDGVEIKISVVGTRDEKQVKFTAVSTSRPDGKFKADTLTGLANQFEKQGSLQGRRSITLSNMPGIEFQAANSSSSAYFRIYQAPTTVYQLIVEAPHSVDAKEIELDVKRFMDSFALGAN